jgi:uncharacterized coiled-coil DUF342 family protein
MALIENFKAMSQLKEELDKIRAAAEEVQRQMAGLAKDVNVLREQATKASIERDEARKARDEYIRKVAKELDEIQSLRVQLRREIEGFDSVKRDLAVNVAKRVESELRDQMASATAELKSRVTDVSAARDTLDSLSQLATKANESVNRLHVMASGIQKSDFELSKALDAVKKAEAEKLEMQQRVERAETFAAKVRRSNLR